MGYIYWMHYHPSTNGKEEVKITSETPIPYDYNGCGHFSDRIYNSRNSNARFYVVTFGYEKSLLDELKRSINRWTIHFIFNGNGKINGDSVKRGDVFIIKQNEYTDIDYGKGDDKLVLGWIALSGTELELMLDVLHLPKEGHFKVSEEAISKIENLFLNTVYKENVPREELPFFMFSRFFESLCLANIPYISTFSTQNTYVDKAMNMININFNKDLSVEDLAKTLHISMSHLRSLFEKEIGISPHQAIINKRISVAKALLQSEFHSSMDSIAESVGYSDQGAFSKRFKKEVGMTPTEYRDSFLKNLLN